MLHALLIEFTALLMSLVYLGAGYLLHRELNLDILPLAVIQLFSISLATLLARRTLDLRTFLSLGFNRDRHTLRDLVFGLTLPAFLLGSTFAIEWSLGWLRIEYVLWKEPSPSVFLDVFIGIVVFILAGFSEELLFRGYRLQNLIEGLNLFWAVLISSVIFALAHLPNPHSSLASTLGIVGAGCFLAYGWVRTGRLWLSIGLHIGWNVFEGVVFGFPVSGLNFPHVVQQTNMGPDLITGGAFGPEAGLVMLPMISVGLVLIWLYTGGKCAHRSWKETIEG